MAAEMADREKPEGENTRLEHGRKNSAHRARDNADDNVAHTNVAHTHKHLVFFVEDHGVASDILSSLDREGFGATAAALAATLRPGDVVALSGGIGAGKTTFVRALVATLHGSDAAVSSPTFVFRQRYPGMPPIEHLDVYRVDDPAAAGDLGLDEAFAADTITLVEWPDRVPGLVPPNAIRVFIEGSGEEARTVRIERDRKPQE